MKKKIAIFTIIFTLIFSSMTMYAAEPSSSEKIGLSMEIAAVYGKIDYDFNEVKEIVIEEYYLDNYDDLRDVSPAFATDHFIQFGLQEERVASPVLDVVKYREQYPDLQLAFGDDWDKYAQHYFQYGIWEGRDNGTDFDPVNYLKMYPDLQEAFGEYNYAAAAKHYVEYGYTEGRDYKVELKINYSFNSDDSDVSDESESDIPEQPESDSNRIEKTDLGDGAYRLIFIENNQIVKEEDYDENNLITYKIEYINEMPVKHSYYEEGVLIEYLVIDYDSEGKIIKETEFNSSEEEIAVREYLYDSAGREIERRAYFSGVLESRYTSEYDANNMLAQITEYNIIDGVETLKSIDTYEYNANGNLRTVTRKDKDGNLEWVITYAEDGEIESESYY